MIVLDHISVQFSGGPKTVQAVRDVSLRIERGEVFGIVGSSGAGKSTLVRTINLLERPSQGRVQIEGTDITDLNGAALRKVRQSIGMIFQHFNLIRTKTVFQNIAFPLRVTGVPHPEITKRVTELLALVGLSDKADVYPGQLSGGQKQRVGIARALANRPAILLCDEPTSALDLETTRSILELLKDINRKLGLTVVLITHEMDVVKKVCDRVAVLEQGELVESGNVYDIFASPQHAATRTLVKQTLQFDLPEIIFRNPRGTLVKVTYRGTGAIDPVLSQTVEQFGVQINVLHGRIEYIGERPIGAFVLSLAGDRHDIAEALKYLEEQTAETQVLHLEEAVSTVGAFSV